VDPAFVQCNLVVLPRIWAAGFAVWCAENPTVAPVLATSAPGSPHLPGLGELDLRTDLPQYEVFRDGEPAETRYDLLDLWSDDLVGFAFGCSFSLEEAMRREGVPLDYEQRGFGGAIYRTTVDTVPAGPFSGPLVVSMRPLPADAVEQAVEVGRRYPWLHGAPVHVGDPAGLGVDLDRPLESFGDVTVADGEVPVFWACGVTTQEVVRNARPELAATHRSAHMLVTDLPLSPSAAAGLSLPDHPSESVDHP
jgi:uncharacterized protein YcsI (UPF0317 family)